jgi:methyl-accepting chemotaxis protein
MKRAGSNPTIATKSRTASLLNSACVRTALLLGTAGALLSVVAAGPTVVVSLAATTLVVASYFAGRELERRDEAVAAAAKRETDAEKSSLAELYGETAIVWTRQIETARGEGDAEVTQLARLFGDIAQKLDKAMGPSQLTRSANGPGQEEILATLERNGRELATLVAALQLLQASKERIVEEIGAEAARLKENASEIRQIALHTRMVSLNATIEAARAGPAGKPFGVIVADMRDLAVRTADASEMFSRHTDRLHGKVAAAFREQAQTDSVVSIAGAEELVQQVVASSTAMMSQLTRAIAAMEDERANVREDVSRVLVSLQFQDRVSQILSHVTRNLEEMQGHIRDSQWSATDGRQWMERMAQTYSTHEEFENHNAARLSAARPAAEVTYF